MFSCVIIQITKRHVRNIFAFVTISISTHTNLKNNANAMRVITQTPIFVI